MSYFKPLMLVRLALFIGPLLAAPFSYGVVDIRDFDTAEQQARYQFLIAELRCPKCQNQNLAGSDSPIAKDLRQELYRLLSAGESDEGIKQFMVDRYGDYVLYRPRVQNNTLVLWLGPFVMGLVGLVVVILIIRRQRKTRPQVAAVDAAQLQALLEQQNEENDQ